MVSLSLTTRERGAFSELSAELSSDSAGTGRG